MVEGSVKSSDQCSFEAGREAMLVLWSTPIVLLHCARIVGGLAYHVVEIEGGEKKRVVEV